MKSLKSTFISAYAAMFLALCSTVTHSAGFQHTYAADPEGKPLELGIWYPSKTVTNPMNLGPTTMAVAFNGPIEGGSLPLVVMSHGTGGSFLGHFDTAIALADAGFVVAAVTHTGDNYADQSRSIDIMDRPRQMSRVIDHMLSAWNGHAVIDPARIGMFGFSAGGFTTLVNIGGVADLSAIGPMCQKYPGDFACKLIAQSKKSVVMPTPRSSTTDQRIKAALVAAPALGFSFSPDGLKNVKIPVQLWRAEDDTVLPQPRYAEAVRLALPAAPDYRVVAKAGHFDFLAPCSAALDRIAPDICKSDANFDRVAFHQTFNATAVEFFDKALNLH